MTRSDLRITDAAVLHGGKLYTGRRHAIAFAAGQTKVRHQELTSEHLW